MLIRGDEVDFLNDVLIAQLVKEVVDSSREKLSKRVIQVDVNQLAISIKIC